MGKLWAIEYLLFDEISIAKPTVLKMAAEKGKRDIKAEFEATKLDIDHCLEIYALKVKGGKAKEKIGD